MQKKSQYIQSEPPKQSKTKPSILILKVILFLVFIKVGTVIQDILATSSSNTSPADKLSQSYSNSQLTQPIYTSTIILTIMLIVAFFLLFRKELRAIIHKILPTDK